MRTYENEIKINFILNTKKNINIIELYSIHNCNLTNQYEMGSLNH